MVREPVRGDHVFVRRVVYSHHGIYCGDDLVVAYYGGLSSSSESISGAFRGVTKTTLAAFALGFPLHIREYSENVIREFPPDLVVQRALKRVGENEYSLGVNNCEHFATWCKCNKQKCSQIKDYAAIAKSSVEIAAAAAVAVAPAAVLQLAGGAAVMGNLAAAGALVGGGVAMGVGVAAAAPALAVNIAIQKVLDDNPDLPQGERDARAVARAGGAVAGAAGVLGAGTMLMGLSGAGMAVEMAAIGGVVGGGMATGAAILVAAPAIAAVAATAGLYGLGKANEAHTEAAEYAKANLQTLTASGVLAAISLDQQLLAQLLEMLGEGLPYIEMPTLGGHVFWSDMAEANGWKLQRNDVFGNCRIIDVTERGKAWGQTGKMIRAINQLATELAKGQNKKKGDPKDGLRLVATSWEAHRRLCNLLKLRWPLDHEPSMGGRVFWSVLDCSNGWRFQKNNMFGNCRILDAADVVKAWGGETEIAVALAKVAIEYG